MDDNDSNIREVLSIGFDTLNDKYVRILTRMLGSLYYIREGSTINHIMINSKDVVPLYRAVANVIKKYDQVYTDSFIGRMEAQILALLYYSILRSRFKNRECSIYRKMEDSISILTVYCSTLSVRTYSESGNTDREGKICASSDFSIPYITKDVPYFSGIIQYSLEPGADLKEIYGSSKQYLITQILCRDDRPPTHFSSIPDISMFR
jgi:hypothetical protein